MNIYIYQKNKLIAGIIAPSLQEFNENPTKFYPHLPEGIFVTSEFKYDYPMIEGSTVRNKNREERVILDNELNLLQNGEIVSDNKIVTIEKPTNLYKPLWQSPNWIESATLDEVKELKRVELKNHRDEEIYEPYIYTNSHIYDADLDSRNRLFQAQQLGVGTSSSTIEWITADNKISSVSNEDLNNIVNGIAFREQQAFSKFSEKYQEVLNCSNVESIKNINW